MKGDVVRTRASGGGIRVSPRGGGSPRLVVEDRSGSTGSGGCLHTLAVHETIKDKNGRDKNVSWSRACVVAHGAFEKDIVHRDSTGREWT